MGNKDERINEFLECLCNGESIYQCESENNLIEEIIEENEEVEDK